MRGNRLQLNYAHLPGLGGMAVACDGSYALTAGVDCAVRAHDVRVSATPWWATDPRREPGLHDVPATDVHEKPITAVALAADCRTFATACEDGFVRIFTADLKKEGFEVDSELVQACARFGGPVRAVDFSPTGAFLAVAGDEPGVLKVVMTAQPSTVTVIRAQDGMGMTPIVALAFDPKSDYVVSVGSDGSAAVWSIDVGACVGLLEVNGRRVLCVAWSPDGGELLVGTDGGAVFVSRESWAFDRLLEDTGGGDADDEDGMEGEADMGGVTGSRGGGVKAASSVLALAWSRNGKYVLTARACSVRLWNAGTMKVLSSWKSDNDLQAMSWHPEANSFMAMDCIGQWGIVSDVVPHHMPTPHEKCGPNEGVKLPELPPDMPARRRTGDDGGGSDDSSDGSENDDDGSDAGRVRPKKLRRRRPSASQSDDASNEEDLGPTIGGSDDEGSNASDRPEINFDADDLEADDEGDVGIIRRDRELARKSAHACNTEDDRERRQARRKRRRAERAGAGDGGRGIGSTSIHVAQASFNPSSTVASSGDSAKKRILRWSISAAVLSHDETSHNLVEVEFADSSRRSIGIKDHFGFSLADVSETGVLLACPKTKDHGSLVSFRPFTSWSASSDWIQSLAVDESVVSIALGGRFAAISSDQSIVRLFSLSGLSTDVFGVAGRIVTTAAYQDKLAVVTAVSLYTPELCYHLFEVTTSGEISNELSTGRLVLTPGSRLEWLGFASDTADLVAYDSTGTIWLFNGKTWLPMLRNAGKVADCGWFWLASVSSEAAIGAQCFGAERTPPAKPRPALRKVSLLAPVVDQVTKAGQSTLDERLFRSRLKLSRANKAKADAEDRYDEDDEEFEDAEEAASVAAREVDKCLLALMEVACRKEQNLRAFDIATRLSSSISLKFAVNLANHYKRTALLERVEEVYRQRVSLDDLEAEKDETSLRRGAVAPSKPVAIRQRCHASDDESEASDSDVSVAAEKERSQEDDRSSPVTPAPPTRRFGSESDSEAVAEGDEKDSEMEEAKSRGKEAAPKALTQRSGKKSSLTPKAVPGKRGGTKQPSPVEKGSVRTTVSLSSAKKRVAPISNRFAKRNKK